MSVWYEWSHHCKNPNHGRSMKHSCLGTFSIKWLYIWPEVMELSYYHHAHTWVNGEFTHGQHDPKSMAHMSQYVPQMSQVHMDPLVQKWGVVH
jgi:hypothetical protein